MFMKATVSVNLEVVINKQFDDKSTMGDAKAVVEAECDKALKKLVEKDKSIKVVSQSCYLNATFQG